jgi:predicted chitinase
MGNNEKPEKKGIFGMIFSAIAGIGTFFTKTLWSGIKPVIWFAQLGLKALPLMTTGITAIAKGIFTLMKTKSLTAAGGSIMDTILDNKDEHPEVRKKRKEDRAEHRKKPGTKLKKFGLAAGVSMATGTALASLQESGLVEDGDLTSSVMGAVDTAATVYGGYQLASAAAGLAGLELSAVAGTAAAATGSALLTGAAWLGTGALALLSSPFVLGALAVGAVGYGLYRLYKAGEGTQVKLRLTQYGISDVESDLAEKVLNAEKALTKFVVIGNGRASLSKDAPLADVLRLFVDDPKDKAKLANVFSWFNGRFKPVFLTYMACLDTVKISSLEEYDKATSQNVYRVASQTHNTLSSVAPYPYSIVAKIDKSVPILAQKDTVIRVNNYLEELKKFIDKKTPDSEKQGIDLPKGAVALAARKEVLEKQLAQPYDSGMTGDQRFKAKVELDDINGRLKDLNSNFKIGPQVSAIYIKDLLPDEGAVSLLTAIRLACYGNEDDVHWRVEAVLKLERYCESLFVFNGKEVVFKGQIGDLFGLFKDAFRLKDGDGDEWCRWFRDRFAPVMSNYVLLVNNYRKGQPGVVWKSLSATARFEIAKGLVETKAKITDSIITPIWNVRASPFEGTSSPGKPDKVDRMVKMLGEASTVAKLRDPEKEAGKTNTKAWADSISPHKTGGGYTPHYANVQTADQYKSRRDMLAGGQYGTNVARGAGTGNLYTLNGVYGTPSNQFGYKALTGDSDTSHLDMSNVQRNEGKDTGVKVPRKLAEQLIIREMLKQGFTDPRAIAEMLALTNYETGGYSKTVENLKYTDPTRLMKLFREVTSLDQARALVAGGEVAIGNAVYGGAKGKSLGNLAPGDGYLYRGRGFVQLTGKANYEKTGREIGVDLVNNPEKLGEDPNVMAAVAVNFFKNSKQLQSITDKGDFGYSARGLNGGNELPGMQDRYKLYLSYLDQLSKGTLKADEESGVDASKDSVGSPSATSSGGGGSAGMYGGGAPSMPPLSPAPGGGSQYGTPNNSAPGGWYGSGAISGANGGTGGGDPSGGYDTTGGGLVLNRTGDNSGLRLKSAETTAGGDVHSGIKRMCQLIQTNVKTFKQFTALNDAWHKQKKPNSKHAKGLALDFTLTNGIASSDYAVAIVKGLAQQAGLTPKDFLVLNEYKRASAGATGGHIHFGFVNEEAANKFNQAAGGNAENGQDTTTGGGPVQQQEQKLTPEPPAPPQVPVEAAVPRGTEEANAPEKTYTPVPLPDRKGGSTNNPQMDTDPGTFQKIGQDNPKLTPKPQPVDTRSNPNAAPGPLIDLDGLAEKIVNAIRETGGTQAQIAAQQVAQLEELNKKSTTAPKAVPVR